MTLEAIIRSELDIAEATFYDANAFESTVSGIANAVRSFLGSEEVLEAAASAIAKQNDGCEWSQMSERAKQWEIGVARAALSSALSKDTDRE